MTVSAQTPINRSTGNGVTTVFPYTFKIIADADIEVTVDDVVKTLNVDYTVSGAGVDAGGNVTMTVAPANATSVVRRRNMALVRSTDYQDQGELPATTLDNDIDATVLMVQQLDERLDRTFSLPASFSGDSTLPAPEPGYLIGWDATGENLTNIPASVGSSLVDLAAPSGSSLIGYQPAGTGAVSTTVQAKLRERVSVLDFGAVGDGSTNDTVAFAAASAAIVAAGGGRLVIPSGTYIVGSQTLAGATGQGYSYQSANIIRITGCTKPVVIEMQGCVLKFAAGLKFGAFDPVTGASYASSSPFTNADYQANIGVAIFLQSNTGGVSIVGQGEIDGNLANQTIGGVWGDTGYQCSAYGILDYNNSSFYVENVYTHHHCLDGIVCGYTGAVAGGPKYPKTLVNVTSEYNARQGLSWVGGNGLTAINCKFNRTGKAVNTGTGVALVSAPGSGVDIEPESAVCTRGVFINCEMINNHATAVVADIAGASNVKFISCTFAGNVWSKMPGFVFEACDFYGGISNMYGSADPTQANSFTDCLFSDVTYSDYTMTASLGTNYFSQAPTAPVYFKRCTINSTRIRTGRLDYCVLENSAINISFGTAAVNNQDYAVYMPNASLVDVTITANITSSAPADGYYIYINPLGSLSGINNLVNTAGVVRWATWSTGAGGYIGRLGDSYQSGAKKGVPALSLFPSQFTSGFYGTLDIYADTAAPVSGTYKRGDKVINQAPTVGQPKGWICTVAGTPGTWVSEGAL